MRVLLIVSIGCVCATFQSADFHGLTNFARLKTLLSLCHEFKGVNSQDPPWRHDCRKSGGTGWFTEGFGDSCRIVCVNLYAL